MISRISSILIAVFFLIACKNDKKAKLSSVDELKSDFIVPTVYEKVRFLPASIYGVWSVEGTFMYSNVLDIKRDGSFSFYERSCGGSSYSEGKCQRADAGYIYVLNSFDKHFNNVQLTLVGDTLYSSEGSKYVMTKQY